MPGFGAKGVKKGANDVLMPEGNPTAVSRESTRHQSRRAEPRSSHRNSRVGTGRGSVAPAFQPCLFPADDLPILVRSVLGGWGLVVSGDVSLAGLREPVLDGVLARYPDQRTAQKVVGNVSRLFRYLEAKGVGHPSDATPELVAGWFRAAFVDRRGSLRRPSQNTVRNRQLAARVMFELIAALGVPLDVAALVGERIPRRAERASALPLTVDELCRVQAHSDGGLIASRRSVLVALALSGGRAAEIAGVCFGKVDLAGGYVTFGGPAARTNPLCEWATETIARFARNNQPLSEGDLLGVVGSPDAQRAASSVTARLWEVLRDAGIAGRDGVTARSIRLTGARRILDQCGIEAATHFLGSPSLDNTAAALGYSWQDAQPEWGTAG